MFSPEKLFRVVRHILPLIADRQCRVTAMILEVPPPGTIGKHTSQKVRRAIPAEGYFTIEVCVQSYLGQDREKENPRHRPRGSHALAQAAPLEDQHNDQQGIKAKSQQQMTPMRNDAP